MTARPDVPDTPDRTDAIARVLMAYEQAHDDADSGAWPEVDDYARWILATDDPAAVAALAANLAERHPDAVLTALTNAGVLTEHVGQWYGGTSTWLQTGHRTVTSDEALALLRKRLSGEVQQP